MSITFSNPSPTDGATNISTNPTLSITPTHSEGSAMNVEFYDASNDSLIGTDSNVTSGSEATVGWSGRSPGTSYDWYVIAGEAVT